MTTEHWRPTAQSLVADLKKVFGDRLQAVVAYGPLLEGVAEAPLTCLALVTSLSADDLRSATQYASRWKRSDIATPLILPVNEFLRSLDVFPLEYGEIIRSHTLIHGDDPFVAAVIAPEDLRRACELQAKSHLVHLREAFIESGGRPTDVAELVRVSAPAFTSLLRNVARLEGVATGDRADATRAGARVHGIPEGLVADILAVERSPGMTVPDPALLFPEYLSAVEQLAVAVDRWRTS